VDPQSDPDWNVPIFDDSGWSNGPAPLGFGDTVSYGTELDDNDGSYYLRNTFYTDPGVEFENLTFYVASDNYAMVYLNGILVDDDSGADHEFSYWNRVVIIPGDYLLEGNNTITAFVYNNASSPDAYFDLKLQGELIVNQSPIIILRPGWNLISLPYIQTVFDIESVFSSISGSYDAIEYYDAHDANDPWKHYRKDKPSHMNDLSEIQNNMGIWIHMTPSADTLFLYNGTQPTLNQTIQLHKGWNLVGYPSLSNHNRTIGLNNLVFNSHIDCIQWFNASTDTWHFMAPNDVFVEGRGYWMHSRIEGLWEVPL
jgi:hypothetical protein